MLWYAMVELGKKNVAVENSGIGVVTDKAGYGISVAYLGSEIDGCLSRLTLRLSIYERYPKRE